VGSYPAKFPFDVAVKNSTTGQTQYRQYTLLSIMTVSKSLQRPSPWCHCHRYFTRLML